MSGFGGPGYPGPGHPEPGRHARQRRYPWPGFARAGRWLGLDHNPARRHIDRVEAWARLGILIFFLLSAPVAAFAASHMSTAFMAGHARARAAAEFQVSATLLGRAPGNYPGPGGDIPGWTPARWTAPDGSHQTGDVIARAGARKGTTVRIWTDRRGQLVQSPPGPGQISSRALTFAVLAPVALGLLLLAAAGLLHRVLDRRRMAAWEAAWSAVEPLWTRRLRG